MAAGLGLVLALATGGGLGAAAGGVFGTRLLLGLLAHMLYPQGTGAPGPEIFVIPLIAVVATLVGGVVGATLAWLLVGGTALVMSAVADRRH